MTLAQESVEADRKAYAAQTELSAALDASLTRLKSGTGAALTVTEAALVAIARELAAARVFANYVHDES